MHWKVNTYISHKWSLKRLHQLPLTVIPAPHAALQHCDLEGQHSVPLSLKEQVLGIFEEHFGAPQLEVLPLQRSLADLLCRVGVVSLYIRRLYIHSETCNSLTARNSII